MGHIPSHHLKDQKIEVEKSQEKRLELNLAVRSM